MRDWGEKGRSKMQKMGNKNAESGKQNAKMRGCVKEVRGRAQMVRNLIQKMPAIIPQREAKDCLRAPPPNDYGQAKQQCSVFLHKGSMR